MKILVKMRKESFFLHIGHLVLGFDRSTASSLLLTLLRIINHLIAIKTVFGRAYRS